MINFSRGFWDNFRKQLAHAKPLDPALADKERETNELIERFRPPTGEWLGLALATTLLHSCILWAGLASLSLTNLDQMTQGDRLLRAAIFPLVFIIALYQGRWVAEHNRPESLAYRLAKWLIIVLVARFVPYLTDFSQLGLDFSNRERAAILFFSSGFVINLLCLVSCNLSGHRQGQLLLKLYVRPQEISIEAPHPIERQTLYRDFKRRLVQGGILIVANVALINFLANQPTRQTSVVNLAVSLTAIYVILALISISWVRLRYLRTGWQLNKLVEPVGLASRWSGYFVGLTLFVIISTLLLPRSTDVILSLPKFDLNWKLDFLNNFFGEGGPRQRPTQPDSGEYKPDTRPSFQFPDWLYLTIGLSLFALIVGFIIWQAYKAGWFGATRPKIKLTWPNFSAVLGVITGFFKWLADLLRGRKLVRPAKETDQQIAGKSWFQRFAREKPPTDPRDLVRYHYRQNLSKANRAGVPRKPTQTPAEYATYLQTRLTDADLTPTDDINQLRTAYEEARFSPHPISPEQAGEIGQVVSRLNKTLRHARKADKP